MAGLSVFVRQVGRFVIIFGILGAGLWGAQQLWHPFDRLIAYVNQDVNAAGSTLSAQLVAGISLGALVLFLILLLVPLLMRGVNNRQFLGSFFRGLLASVVFLLSDSLYSTLEQWGRFYLVVGVATSVIITFFLIEIITRAGKRQQQVGTRTDLMASVTSGLAFGLLLKLGSFAWQYFQTVVGR